MMNTKYDRFLARFEAPAIEAPAIEALVIEAPVIEALLIEALPVDTNTNEPPNTDSFTFEALPVETDEPAIPFANTTEPSTSTTLIPPQSIPPTDSYLAYTLTFTYTLHIPRRYLPCYKHNPLFLPSACALPNLSSSSHTTTLTSTR
jgi:hypothetical protein